MKRSAKGRWVDGSSFDLATARQLLLILYYKLPTEQADYMVAEVNDKMKGGKFSVTPEGEFQFTATPAWAP